MEHIQLNATWGTAGTLLRWLFATEYFINNSVAPAYTNTPAATW